MAIKKIRDAVVKTGSYTDRNGQTKGRFENVGELMKSDDGSSFLLLKKTFNPAGVPDLTGNGGDRVLISFYEPKDQEQPQAAAPAPVPASANRSYDEPPF